VRQIDMGDSQIYRNSHSLFGSYPYAIMLSRGDSRARPLGDLVVTNHMRTPPKSPKLHTPKSISITLTTKGLLRYGPNKLYE
jgi:hypothetical protein